MTDCLVDLVHLFFSAVGSACASGYDFFFAQLFDHGFNVIEHVLEVRIVA